MILWTIQHKNAYEKMLATGSLTADDDYIFAPEFNLPAYQWLSTRMENLIGEPPAGVHFPVWAWYQWEGVRKRPDMRTHRRWTTKGTPIVLITFEIPDNMVLLSDFDMWHVILNDGYLALTEDDDKDDYTEEEKTKSWDNVFQYDLQNDYWGFDCKSTQATMWEIKSEWILKAEHFISG